MRCYYVQYDWSVAKNNSGYGFSNTKRAVAFLNKKQASEFVSVRSRYDFTCERITRAAAYKLKEIVELDYSSVDEYKILRDGEVQYGVRLSSPEFYDYLGVNEKEI